MTQLKRMIAIASIASIFSAAASASGVRITAINFHGTATPNEIEILGNGPIDAQKQVNTEDHQVVITIPGATLSKGIKRAIDTSSFNSPVTLISPYQTNGDNAGVRIVVQLRSDANADLSQSGNSIKLTIGSGSGASADGTSQDSTSAAASAPSDGSDAASAPEIGTAQANDVAPSAAASQPHDQMQKFLNDSKNQQFNGKPITLQVRDADVADIFSLIADSSGFNIILGDDVKGKLTLSLVDVPWDQALDVVLKTLQLGADRNGNVLRVMTLKDLAAEKQLEYEALKANEAITPRITRVFPINYADLGSLKASLTTLLGGKGGANDIAQASATNPASALAAVTATGGATGLAATPSTAASSSAVTDKLSVVADDRTNSLVVQTLPDNMERVRKLIEILDTQTPEVLIEGKVIEATENFNSNIGGSLGIADIANGAYSVAFSGANAIDPLLGTGTAVVTDTNVTTNSQNGGQFGWSLVKSSPRITMLLNIGQSENKLKIISSPRAVVLNKQEATVVQSTPVIVPATGIGPNGGIVTTSQVQQANLSLDVTPTVTSDGGVLMKLTLERDIPVEASGATEANAVANRSIKTNVLVDSGNTLVMGGFYTAEKQDGSTGFPVLKDIPIIGWLFGNDTHETDRSEIFFFVTPQILNAKKSGPPASSTVPTPEQVPETT